MRFDDFIVDIDFGIVIATIKSVYLQNITTIYDAAFHFCSSLNFL